MFRKRTEDPFYRFKDLERKVRWASVRYGAKDKSYIKEKSRWASFCIYVAVFIPCIIDYNMRLWDFWRNRSYEGHLCSCRIFCVRTASVGCVRIWKPQ